MITNFAQAEHHAKTSLRGSFDSHKTVIVSESGDVHADCDVDATVKTLKKEKTKHFIVKGQESADKTN